MRETLAVQALPWLAVVAVVAVVLLFLFTLRGLTKFV